MVAGIFLFWGVFVCFGGFLFTPVGGGVIIPGTPIIPFMQPAPLIFGQSPPQKLDGRGLVK